MSLFVSPGNLGKRNDGLIEHVLLSIPSLRQIWAFGGNWEQKYCRKSDSEQNYPWNWVKNCSIQLLFCFKQMIVFVHQLITFVQCLIQFKSGFPLGSSAELFQLRWEHCSPFNPCWNRIWLKMKGSMFNMMLL